MDTLTTKINKNIINIIKLYLDYSLDHASQIYESTKISNLGKLKQFKLLDLIFKSIQLGYRGFWITLDFYHFEQFINNKIGDENLYEWFTIKKEDHIIKYLFKFGQNGILANFEVLYGVINII